MKKGFKFLILGIIFIGPVAWGLLWKYGKTSYSRLPVMGTVEMTGDTTPWLIPDFAFVGQTGDSVTEKNF